jgi:hypothetical protein
VDEREWRPAAESIYQQTLRGACLRFRVTQFLSELFVPFSKLATLPAAAVMSIWTALGATS